MMLQVHFFPLSHAKSHTFPIEISELGIRNAVEKANKHPHALNEDCDSNQLGCTGGKRSAKKKKRRKIIIKI